MATHLHPVDLIIVAFYLIGITLFGLRFAKKGDKKTSKAGPNNPAKSLKSYFLADNTIPWWAIALSIVSAETSTLTIISIPGVAFAGDFGFLQIVIGYMLGRIVVALLFLPRYFRGEMLTAYQLIDQRFGKFLHKITAGLFLLTRAAAEGVRVFAVSIVVSIAIGTGSIASIGIISALTLLYTFEGGMAAVIWTDVVQMAIYLAGTLIAVWSLGHHVPGGWNHIYAIGQESAKFHIFDFALNLTTTYTFWAGVLGGTFLTMASHGTDQLMVQRMLAARSLRESRLALLSSGVVIFIQFALFLLIGAGLYVFYGPHSASLFHSGDYIFPTFIVRELPLGIAGLLVAAILAAAMSNLSAALNSLSSTTVVDFYMSLRPTADDRERNLISRSSTVLWAIVLFAIAIYSLSVGGKGHVVEIGLSIASVAYGCLLGVFLLGTLTKFATEIGTAIGMLCGFALNLWLWQGTFPKTFFAAKCPDGVDFKDCLPASGITIPHIAWTWYVLIGALATFLIGALMSLIFRKQSSRKALTTAASLLLFAVILSAAKDPRIVHAQTLAQSQPDFSPITQLINDAIAAHKLPGAVVIVGHNGHQLFEHAYGDRKLANEPGLDGTPSPAEPMTEDTIFDMASLSKDLATATAVMQLYDAGKITSFDDPVEKYLPAFNPTHDATRSRVTLRMLLTHTSGEAPDISLKDPWGLAAPDRAEGFHRALTSPLAGTPGAKFVYSDINFILLGYLVEQLSGQREDDYALQHIFKPLGMTHTRYLPLDRATCMEKREIVGAAIGPLHPNDPTDCLIETSKWPGTWPLYQWVPNIAPTTHDDEGNAQTNPHYEMLTRGTVHDPTTRRMGGVAGHAGVFSTAHDVSLFASALLEKLLHNTGPFPVKQSTLRLMTQPEQPDPANPDAHLDAEMQAQRGAHELQAANAAEAAAIAAGDKPAEPGLAPHYPAIKGQDLRGYGWDIDTAFSKPRGLIFPIGSFGHTGYTGTTLWMDPYSDTYVVLLSNAVHPYDHHHPISNLRGEVSTAAARALGLTLPCTTTNDCHPERSAAQSKDPDALSHPIAAQDLSATDTPTSDVSSRPERSAAERPASGPSDTPQQTESANLGPDPLKRRLTEAEEMARVNAARAELHGSHFGPYQPHTLTGIDVLESTNFTALRGLHNIGLLTNQTGRDAQGARTVDILYKAPGVHLTTLFSPEHGINGALDQSNISSTTDAATHLPVISLYGSKPADRHPTHAQLKDLDAVVIDLQDAGVRYWTYEAASLYFLEAAATEQRDYHHNLQIIVLDRPNPIGGLAMQGPISDPDHHTYVDALSIPSRHGLTLGELLRYDNATQHLEAPLTVIPMLHWQRSDYFAETGLPWIAPSPNLRTPEAAILYPTLGLIETTNISVGRGTDHPFSFFGAGTPTQKSPSEEPCGIPVQSKEHEELHILRVQALATGPTDGTYSDGGHGQGEFDRVQLVGVIKSSIQWKLGSVFSVHPFPGEHTEAHDLAPERLTPGNEYILVYTYSLDHEPSAATQEVIGLKRCGAFMYSAALGSAVVKSLSTGVAVSATPANAWFNATDVAAYLTARHIPGVTFTAATESIADDANHYPFHGQSIPAVRLAVTDRTLFNSPECAIEILSVLHRLYPTQFHLDRAMTLVASKPTLDAIAHGDDPRSIAASWQPAIDSFRRAVLPFLLY